MLKELDGFDLVILAAEGYVVEYRGSREEAEDVAAKLSELHREVERSVSGEVGYLSIPHNGKLTFVLRKNEYVLILRGEEKVVSSYLQKILDIARGKLVRCSKCGEVLDAYVAKCIRCGSTILLTSPSCPICGNRIEVRRCPRCGTLIDHLGNPIKSFLMFLGRKKEGVKESKKVVDVQL